MFNSSYDAQYGKTGGGVFNAILKSGTTDYHITAWEFMRRRWLDTTGSRTTVLVRSGRPTAWTNTVSNWMVRFSSRNCSGKMVR